MKKYFRHSVIVFFFVASLVSCEQKKQSNGPSLVTGENVAVANTEFGKVRGYIHNNIYTYKGIPYAQAERFMPPSKPKSWEGVRSSMSYGPVCPMMDPVNVTGDEGEFVFHHDWGFWGEDCQRLNIWTPEIKGEKSEMKKRPVMVWLHGGGHVAGSSQELPSYEGENLAKRGDVVVVTINHRLNILGFLNLSAYGDKYKSSPNVSIMDIVAALHWVKDNIANFGGDPDNVLIFGQSGGGGKVNTLLNAPSAKGFFHKAVVQSGGLGLKFNSNETTQRIAEVVLQQLKLKPSQVDSLQKIPYTQLAAAGKKATAIVRAELEAKGEKLPPIVGLSWGPILDGTFLPYQPTDEKAKEISSNIPLLIGSTKNEFMNSLRNPMLRKAAIDSINSFIKAQYKDKSDAYIAAVKKAYPNDTRPSDLIDVDMMFRRSAIKMAKLKSETSTAPVYMYLFAYQSPVMDGVYKSVHCMEIPFVFNNIARCEEMTGGTPEAYALAEKVCDAWVAFARTGNPNHKGIPDWGAYKKDNGNTMIFDNQCEVKQNHDKDILAVVPDVSL